VLMFPLLLQTIISNQMRPRRLRGAWFSRLLRHPARRQSGSIVSPGTHTGFTLLKVRFKNLAAYQGCVAYSSMALVNHRLVMYCNCRQCNSVYAETGGNYEGNVSGRKDYRQHSAGEQVLRRSGQTIQSINQFIKNERTKRPLTSQYKIHDIKYINTHKHI